MFFSNAMREKVKADNPGIAFGEVGKKLGELWRGASAEEKAEFEEKAAADKASRQFWMLYGRRFLLHILSIRQSRQSGRGVRDSAVPCWKRAREWNACRCGELLMLINTVKSSGNLRRTGLQHPNVSSKHMHRTDRGHDGHRSPPADSPILCLQLHASVVHKVVPAKL